ncbi:hypothetical protein SNEBB_002429 [Seison nebaliae]|nr:hypothetical protein SNEBB_002429 [Seison nebaliae]
MEYNIREPEGCLIVLDFVKELVKDFEWQSLVCDEFLEETINSKFDLKLDKLNNDDGGSGSGKGEMENVENSENSFRSLWIYFFHNLIEMQRIVSDIFGRNNRMLIGICGKKSLSKVVASQCIKTGMINKQNDVIYLLNNWKNYHSANLKKNFEMLPYELFKLEYSNLKVTDEFYVERILENLEEIIEKNSFYNPMNGKQLIYITFNKNNNYLNRLIHSILRKKCYEGFMIDIINVITKGSSYKNFLKENYLLNLNKMVNVKSIGINDFSNYLFQLISNLYQLSLTTICNVPMQMTGVSKSIFNIDIIHPRRIYFTAELTDFMEYTLRKHRTLHIIAKSTLLQCNVGKFKNKKQLPTTAIAPFTFFNIDSLDCIGIIKFLQNNIMLMNNNVDKHLLKEFNEETSKLKKIIYEDNYHHNVHHLIEKDDLMTDYSHLETDDEDMEIDGMKLNEHFPKTSNLMFDDNDDDSSTTTELSDIMDDIDRELYKELYEEFIDDDDEVINRSNYSSTDQSENESYDELVEKNRYGKTPKKKLLRRIKRESQSKEKLEISEENLKIIKSENGNSDEGTDVEEPVIIKKRKRQLDNDSESDEIDEIQTDSSNIVKNELNEKKIKEENVKKEEENIESIGTSLETIKKSNEDEEMTEERKEVKEFEKLFPNNFQSINEPITGKKKLHRFGLMMKNGFLCLRELSWNQLNFQLNSEHNKEKKLKDKELEHKISEDEDDIQLSPGMAEEEDELLPILKSMKNVTKSLIYKTIYKNKSGSFQSKNEEHSSNNLLYSIHRWNATMHVYSKRKMFHLYWKLSDHIPSFKDLIQLLISSLQLQMGHFESFRHTANDNCMDIQINMIAREMRRAELSILLIVVLESTGTGISGKSLIKFASNMNNWEKKGIIDSALKKLYEKHLCWSRQSDYILLWFQLLHLLKSFISNSHLILKSSSSQLHDDDLMKNNSSLFILHLYRLVHFLVYFGDDSNERYRHYSSLVEKSSEYQFLSDEEKNLYEFQENSLNFIDKRLTKYYGEEFPSILFVYELLKQSSISHLYEKYDQTYLLHERNIIDLRIEIDCGTQQIQNIFNQHKLTQQQPCHTHYQQQQQNEILKKLQKDEQEKLVIIQKKEEDLKSLMEVYEVSRWKDKLLILSNITMNSMKDLREINENFNLKNQSVTQFIHLISPKPFILSLEEIEGNDKINPIPIYDHYWNNLFVELSTILKKERDWNWRENETKDIYSEKSAVVFIKFSFDFHGNSYDHLEMLLDIKRKKILNLVDQSSKMERMNVYNFFKESFKQSNQEVKQQAQILNRKTKTQKRNDFNERSYTKQINFQLIIEEISPNVARKIFGNFIKKIRDNRIFVEITNNGIMSTIIPFVKDYRLIPGRRQQILSDDNRYECYQNMKNLNEKKPEKKPLYPSMLQKLLLGKIELADSLKPLLRRPVLFVGNKYFWPQLSDQLCCRYKRTLDFRRQIYTNFRLIHFLTSNGVDLSNLFSTEYYFQIRKKNYNFEKSLKLLKFILLMFSNRIYQYKKYEVEQLNYQKHFLENLSINSQIELSKNKEIDKSNNNLINKKEIIISLNNSKRKLEKIFSDKMENYRNELAKRAEDRMNKIDANKKLGDVLVSELREEGEICSDDEDENEIIMNSKDIDKRLIPNDENLKSQQQQQQQEQQHHHHNHLQQHKHQQQQQQYFNKIEELKPSLITKNIENFFHKISDDKIEVEDNRKLWKFILSILNISDNFIDVKELSKKETSSIFHLIHSILQTEYYDPNILSLNERMKENNTYLQYGIKEKDVDFNQILLNSQNIQNKNLSGTIGDFVNTIISCITYYSMSFDDAQLSENYNFDDKQLFRLDDDKVDFEMDKKLPLIKKIFENHLQKKTASSSLVGYQNRPSKIGNNENIVKDRIREPLLPLTSQQPVQKLLKPLLANVPTTSTTSMPSSGISSTQKQSVPESQGQNFNADVQNFMELLDNQELWRNVMNLMGSTTNSSNVTDMKFKDESKIEAKNSNPIPHSYTSRPPNLMDNVPLLDKPPNVAHSDSRSNLAAQQKEMEKLAVQFLQTTDLQQLLRQSNSSSSNKPGKSRKRKQK